VKLGYTTDDAGVYAGLYLDHEDRCTHLYVVGSSGVGKSKALATWILNDIESGSGCAVIDPHGDLIRDVISNVANAENVILVDLTDPDFTIGFNPLERQPGIDPFTQTLELVEVFRKIWNLSDDATPRLLEILRNAVHTLIDAGGTMLDIEPLLTNGAYRQSMIQHVTNEAVVSFWENRFDKWEARDRVANVESTLNKVSAFTSDPRIRLMLSSKHSTVNFREVMDQGQVVLINLSKGVLRTNSFLLGALFVAKIQMAAMSRQELAPSLRRPFYLYVDEFQNYATLSFAEIMSEARKYGLSLILAHQSLAQLDDTLRAIILSNAKNLVVFRVDRMDAELLVKYLGAYDPFMVKTSSLESEDYYGMGEQWELETAELSELPERTALLKTKGCEPTLFATYDLSDTGPWEGRRAIIREANRLAGYTVSLRQLDTEVMLSAGAWAQPDEPEAFIE
jgi:type IV secretory pathway TraG/TraD family ATPase VirD4